MTSSSGRDLLPSLKRKPASFTLLKKEAACQRPGMVAGKPSRTREALVIKEIPKTKEISSESIHVAIVCRLRLCRSVIAETDGMKGFHGFLMSRSLAAATNIHSLPPDCAKDSTC